MFGIGTVGFSAHPFLLFWFCRSTYVPCFVQHYFIKVIKQAELDEQNVEVC